MNPTAPTRPVPCAFAVWRLFRDRWHRAGTPILAFPLLARLHQPGKDHPGCAGLVQQMLAEILGWFPDRTFTLVGDGAYACKELLSDLDERVAFVGRLRGDAAVYDPHVPKARNGRRGAKAKKGPRLPKPREAAAKADRKRTGVGAWVWRPVEVSVYGRRRSVWVVDYEAVWPWVLGSRAIRVWVVRDPEGRMKDCYLFTTDRAADASWVVTRCIIQSNFCDCPGTAKRDDSNSVGGPGSAPVHRSGNGNSTRLVPTAAKPWQWRQTSETVI